MAGSNPDIDSFAGTAQRDPLLKWYAIADSAQHRGLPGALVRDGHSVRCLLGASQGSPVALHAPHLVELCSPLDSSNTWHWISLNSQSKPCVTVIATRMPFDALFTQLVTCTEVILPDGDAMFFAFWDPAILGTLMGQQDDPTLHVKGPVLHPDQWSLLTGGMSAWWYWDRIGRMHAIAVSPNVKPADKILLTQRQVDDLVEASVPDHILYYLELNQPLLIGNVPFQMQYEFVRRAMSAGRDIGLFAMGDLVNFVCVELIYKERMQGHDIQRLLSEVKHGRLPFGEALDKLP